MKLASTAALGEIKALERTEKFSTKERALGNEGGSGSLMHKEIPYSSDKIAHFVHEVRNSSEQHYKTLSEGKVTSALKGDVNERAISSAMAKWGELTKLPHARDLGSVTADFKLVLNKELVISNRTFKPGDIGIIETKTGDPKYVLNEFRNPESHGRIQLAETAKNFDADFSIALLSRDIQGYPAEADAIRLSMKENEGRDTYLYLVGPSEKAITSAIEKVRLQIADSGDSGRSNGKNDPE